MQFKFNHKCRTYSSEKTVSKLVLRAYRLKYFHMRLIFCWKHGLALNFHFVSFLTISKWVLLTSNFLIIKKSVFIINNFSLTQKRKNKPVWLNSFLNATNLYLKGKKTSFLKFTVLKKYSKDYFQNMRIRIVE